MSGVLDVKGLVDIVGLPHVLRDPDQRAGFEVDWTRRFGAPCLAVVRPASLAEVQGVVRWCAQHRVGIVPQGGNTGLVGGGVPGRDEPRVIVLSTTRLTHIGDVDLSSGQLTVGAGVTLEDLDRALAGSGWEFGVDLGARASATLGGMFSTNAGGTRVLRYGSMRANTVGVEAVLPTGETISHLQGLLKDNTGYDLTGLLCGGEGTLAVVTAVRLRLVPSWPDRVAVAIACDSWADAVSLAARIRRSVDGLDGLEAVDRPGAELVESMLGVRRLLPGAEVTLYAVWAGEGEPPSRLSDLVIDRKHVVGDVRQVLQSRERQTEAIARLGVPHKFDVTLPLASLAAFADEVRSTLPDSSSAFLFGHLGDGNLHVNVVGPPPEDTAVDGLVLETVARYGGSVSAEHGIGRAKARYLELSRSETEIAAMRSIKRALDPEGMMNPGVLFNGGPT